MNSVKAKLRPGILRTALVFCVALSQVHLLWIAVTHRHVADELSPRAAQFQPGVPQPSPAADSGLLCTACQIVRHSAAMPATGTLVPEPAGSVFLRPALVLSSFCFFPLSVIYGRAPPLS
jgi:hypothetical protein